MESLRIYRRDEMLSQVVLGERPVELGRGVGCDVVLDGPGVAERHWLALRARGTVIAYDVSGPRTSPGVHLPLGERVALAGDHSVERVAYELGGAPSARSDRPGTEALRPSAVAASYRVVIGRGADARKVLVSDAPLQIGRALDGDVVLMDAAVSVRHCRLVALPTGLSVCDLGSKNGTFANGVRVERALIPSGSCLRVGRTDLFVFGSDAQDRILETPLVAASPAMLALLGEVERVAPLSWPVLVHGPSGAGKEGIARLLHERSPRHNRELVAVNAGGVPADLIESELFGHERGAFTGAQQTRRGVFEQADGGTLFIDEVGELPLALQSRLLRVLDSGEIRRVGAEGTRKVDVRLVCATHRDLRAMVGAGRFRLDLYHRIARVVLEVPPLRVRPEDLRAIADSVVEQLSYEVGPRVLSAEAHRELRRHGWPGNVRELRNVLCSAALHASAGVIEVEHVAAALSIEGVEATPDLERDEQILATLDRCGGNLTRAALALGLPRSTLRGRVRALRGEGG